MRLSAERVLEELFILSAVVLGVLPPGRKKEQRINTKLQHSHKQLRTCMAKKTPLNVI